MNKFMLMAIDEAKSGIECGHGGPFGAVIVKDGAVIGKGHNRVVEENNPTRHGEMVAISDACKNINSFDLSGCDIYTTSEPCPMFLCALLWANIKSIYVGCNKIDAEKIGFRDEKFYEILKKDKPMKFETINRKECLELFKEYESLTNKKQY